MRIRTLTIPALALTFGALGTATARAESETPAPYGSQPAQATSPSTPGMPGMDMPSSAASSEAPEPQVDLNAAIARARQKPVFLAARLSGRNEVPVAGKPAVGDPDGSATGVVRVQGDRVTFAFSWKNIGAPTLGHIHEGVAGANGDVKVPLFTSPMPDTTDAAAGAVTVSDPAVADRLRANPSGFYLNLHSKEFPGGAVRGQLAPLNRAADVLALLKGGGARAFLAGDQEVPVANGPKVGDPDGRAVAFIRARGDQVGYSFAWLGVNPTLGHIHKGAFGVNGPVVVPLFTTPVPNTVFAISGTATGVDRAVVSQIAGNPSGFYANLHSAEFPGGAVRGQLFN
ncbi:CHRD domain-containing protein [Actinoallomurus purpureus]|uniref:CHRD domain-containing protein n=1 Tax=Actinoallomurus purpureus TaxID=478114 RepID=UPI002092A3C6|nr:CHRD domain-containing protein [Actinoallomurus purpureus]MCO6010061.1 CHRD domain-containing protein [Actinoallomurus purpureus]